MNSRSIIPPEASQTGDRRPKRWRRARGRRLALASLVSAILIATLWSIASVSGAGFFGGEKMREAGAQTPGGDRQQIGQNDPAGGGSQQNGAIQDGLPQAGDSDTAGYNEEAYAAFGDERNPFEPVLSQASEAGTGGDGDSAGDGGDDDLGADANATTGDGANADANAGGGADANANTGDGADADANMGGTNGGTGGGGNGGIDGGGVNRPPGQGGEGMVMAPGGEMVDCSDTGSDFERLICEEERQAGDNDPEDTTQVPRDGRGQQGPPGSGGSGRSGAGDTADDFRNGGGGVSK